MFKFEVSAKSIFHRNDEFDSTKINLTNEGNIIICNIKNEMFYINKTNLWTSFVQKMNKMISLKKFTLEQYLKEKQIDKQYLAKTKEE